ncbi:ABC transporter permease [Frondihabitans australicus]|uniref:Peptide/nickel transport system permease protein n=1 Tax=Frondihabitans australicus TaxID=386892 RepID=A0A495IEH5_9MICO|nr:ABC transporter permease [Frondihabitans australicus]RKR73761.1 peptide/nickel transport system permease protein [Frondihabitans australicus]
MVRELLRRPAGVAAGVWILLLVISAVVSTFWTPHDPFATDPYHQWETPSPAHLFGTDGIGRDIFSYVFAATRTTLIVAVLAGVLASLVGIGLAALGSLTARWVREAMAVLIDILIAFPVILIAMLLSSILGGSLGVVITAVGIGYGVNIARVTRGEIRRVRGTDYVLAARAGGVSSGGVLVRHILPNVAPVFVVQLSLAMATSILAEAGLSYLGYGASASTASWGRLLNDLQVYIAIHPGSVVWPGAAITLTVLAFNLLGDAIREASDPRLRVSRSRAQSRSQDRKDS